MYRPDAEMEDFTARRGYSPAFIRKVHEKRRKERLARVEADRLAKRQLAVEDREARKLTARDRKLLSQEPCANADSDALFAMPAPGWVKDIVAHVCKAHGVSISLLLGERRSKAIVAAIWARLDSRKDGTRQRSICRAAGMVSAMTAVMRIKASRTGGTQSAA